MADPAPDDISSGDDTAKSEVVDPAGILPESGEVTRPQPAKASGLSATLPATPVASPLAPPEGGTQRRPPVVPPDLGPDTTQDREAVEERMAVLVEREAIATFRQRMLSTIRLGVTFWIGFLFLDLVSYFRGDARWWWYLLARVAILPFVLGMYVHLRARREASRPLLRFYETSLFTVAIAGTSVIYAFKGGWESPEIAASTVVVMGYAVLLGGAWRRSWVPVLSMTLTLPLTLLVMSFVLDELRLQLTDPGVMITFAQHFAVVIAAGLLALFAGNKVYSLRQEIASARSIGRYRLRRRIAAGGMGEVWAAYHAGLGRDVAVKLIQPSLGTDPTAIARFEREVRTLAELTHPNTIRVFDYGATEAGVWYYAMELLDARDLSTVVAQDGPLLPDRAVRLVSQAADALAEAHARGIVHRDIKPANLLLVHTDATVEFVKVIDFGIAQQTDEDAQLTQTGMLVGTPGFIAPEVITGGRATPRSDVYALGMVLYVLLTGASPFEGTTPAAILRDALSAPPPPPSAAREGIPEGLDRLVMRCLSPDPLERFRSASELAAGLRDLGA